MLSKFFSMQILGLTELLQLHLPSWIVKLNYEIKDTQIVEKLQILLRDLTTINLC